jgi:hypothetical protein
MQYEITFKLFDSPGYTSGGASQYVTVVEAINQPAAQTLVQNMNGGSSHCHIVRCMLVG